MKTALVTGGNRGLGFEIAKGLQARGFRVIITSRTAKKAQKAAEGIGENAIPLELDQSKESSIKKGVKQIASQVDQLDVLINNAGVMGTRPLTEFDSEQVEEVWRTNAFGPLLVIKQCKALLDRSPHPRIINMSSGMGEIKGLQAGGYFAYRWSKWALNGLSIQLAADLPKRYFVAVMCPGWCQTDMGGQNAPRSAHQGADTAIWLATENNLPTGKFWRDRREIHW